MIEKTDLENQIIATVSQHSPWVGDDCSIEIEGERRDASAAIRMRLTTTDALVEDVHFRRAWSTPEQCAVKLWAVNLSDIAAMGGKPRKALLNLGLPTDLPSAWAVDFLKKFLEIATEYDIDILGGDTFRSPAGIFLSLTVIGSVLQQNLKTRKGAQPGDHILVTGVLGEAGLGLLALERGLREPDFGPLIQKQLQPQARLTEGQWFAKQAAVKAMMDLSDGLSQDLGKLTAISACQYKVDLSLLPVSSHAENFARRYNIPLHEAAWQMGEDYELLVCVAPQASLQIIQEFESQFDRPLTKIGSVSDEIQCITYEGQPISSMTRRSFSHFCSDLK